MRRWSVVLVLMLMGCGGSDGLDRAELADRADAICSKYAEQARQLGEPDLASLQEAEQYFTRTHELATEQQEELDALEPAEADAADFNRLTTATAKSTDLLARLAAAGRAGDDERLRSLFQELPPLVTEVDDAARTIGAESCASP